MSFYMTFDYDRGSKTSLPFNCRIGSWFVSSDHEEKDRFFRGRNGFHNYIRSYGFQLVGQYVYEVKDIQYSLIADGKRNRATVVLDSVGELGGFDDDIDDEEQTDFENG